MRTKEALAQRIVENLTLGRTTDILTSTEIYKDLEIWNKYTDIDIETTKESLAFHKQQINYMSIKNYDMTETHNYLFRNS